MQNGSRKNQRRSIVEGKHESNSFLKRRNMSAEESIRRGRAALTDAEDHIKAFEDILQSSIKCIEESEIEEIPLREDSEDTYWQKVEEMVKNECSLDEVLAAIDPTVKNLIASKDRNESTTLMDNASFTQGSRILNQTFNTPESKGYQQESYTSRHESGVIINSQKTSKSSQIASMKALSTPRRDFKRRRYKEKDLEEFKQFKARPLPGGVLVNNNPYAWTKSAQAKANSRKEASPDESSTSSFNQNILSAHIFLNKKSDVSKSQLETEVRVQVESASKRKKLFDDIHEAATKVIEKEFEDYELSESLEDFVDEYDLSNLQQQILKLKAELRSKKKESIKTIHALEEETKCRKVGETKIKDITGTILDKSAQRRKEENKFCYSTPQKMSTYERQKAWLDHIAERRIDAKVSNEEEELRGVTGTPNLRKTKSSWFKAKESHDKILETSKKKEIEMKKYKKEKERNQYMRHVKEAEEMKQKAIEQTRRSKKHINRQVQAEYAKKLSRPFKRVKIHPKKEEEFSPQSNKKSSRFVDKSSKQKKLIVEIPYSFMNVDDKDLGRMIKNVQKKANKLKHKPMKFF